MDGRGERCMQSCGWKILKGRDVWGNPHVNGRVILEINVENVERMWTGLIWLRIEFSGKLL